VRREPTRVLLESTMLSAYIPYSNISLSLSLRPPIALLESEYVEVC